MTQNKQTAWKQWWKQVEPAGFGGWSGIKWAGGRAPDPMELHWLREDFLNLLGGNFQQDVYGKIPKVATTVVDAQPSASDEAVMKTPVQMEAEVYTVPNLVGVYPLLPPYIADAFSPAPHQI